MQLDWRKTDHYAYAAELDAAGRAWEYLRRSAKYKQAWEEYRNLKSNLEAKYGPMSGWGAAAYSGVVELFHYDPPRLLGERYGAWLDRAYSARKEPSMAPHDVALARPFRLSRLLDPGKSATGQELFFPDRPTIWFSAQDVPDPSNEAWGAFAYIKLDLGKHLSTQLKRAQEDLLSFQKRQVERGRLTTPHATRPPRKHPQFVAHLRFLDAQEAGAAKDDIAAVLFPDRTNQYPDYVGRKALDEIQTQAEYYRDGGYRALI